jgi:hypothetical protein
VVASEAESRTSTTGSRFCHWERHKLSYGVERTGRIPFKTTHLLALGSLETYNQYPLDEGQKFDASIRFLRELAVEPAYWTFTGIQVGLMAGQYLGGQAVGIWKRGPAINLKDTIIDKWFGDGYWKLNALTSPWGCKLACAQVLLVGLLSKNCSMIRYWISLYSLWGRSRTTSEQFCKIILTRHQWKTIQNISRLYVVMSEKQSENV